MVWFGSMIKAGPAILLPGLNASRRKTPAARHAPFGEDFAASAKGFNRCRSAVAHHSSSRRASPVSRAFDADCLDDHRLVVIDETELRLVGDLEIALGLENRVRLEIHRQCRVGAVIADVQHGLRGNGILGDALRRELGDDGFSQGGNEGVDLGSGLFGKRLEQCLLA